MRQDKGYSARQSTFYRSYLLVLLTGIVTFNYVDRVALGVLMQSIKGELHISDTQIGLLSGIAFAVFYSVMGVPIARWADRGNRVTIISLTTLLWSLGVMICAAAQNYGQLLSVRVAVAVGEAGCVPPAFSLIADYFSRAERPRAVAIYGLGGGIACVVGYLATGWLNELYGWRMAFVLLGAPGPILAALARWTLKEPRHYCTTQSVRGHALAKAKPTSAQPTIREVVITLCASPTFRHLLVCLAVSSFFSYGVLQWQPAFFQRSHGLSSAQMGSYLAVAYGLSAITGSFLGGELASRYAANDERLQLRGMSAAMALSSVMSLLVYISSNMTFSFACLAVATVGQYTLNGPLFSTIQTLVPERMRAVSFSLVYLFSNLVGMGLGPLVVGALSDTFNQWAANESLRYALALLSPGYIWAAWHAWKASNTVSADLLVGA